MTPAWISLWTRAMDISTGAPEVISRRLHLMQPHSLWSLSTLLEMQRMVMEKMAAVAESGWALYASSLAQSAWPMLGTTEWWAPTHQRRLSHHALRSVDKALAPMSKRVNANVRRLRRG
jgi:hypothetical protein